MVRVKSINIRNMHRTKRSTRSVLRSNIKWKFPKKGKLYSGMLAKCLCRFCVYENSWKKRENPVAILKSSISGFFGDCFSKIVFTIFVRFFKFLRWFFIKIHVFGRSHNNLWRYISLCLTFSSSSSLFGFLRCESVRTCEWTLITSSKGLQLSTGLSIFLRLFLLFS